MNSISFLQRHVATALIAGTILTSGFAIGSVHAEDSAEMATLKSSIASVNGKINAIRRKQYSSNEEVKALVAERAELDKQRAELNGRIDDKIAETNPEFAEQRRQLTELYAKKAELTKAEKAAKMAAAKKDN